MLTRARSDHTSHCTDPRCFNAVLRTVWDGDQVLHEISTPGCTGVDYAAMNADNAPPPAYAEGVYHWGRVMYVHGGGIDRPLMLTRSAYSDSLSWDVTVVPTTNWRGLFNNGARFAACVSINEPGTEVRPVVWGPGEGSGEIGTGSGGETFHCADVDWPGERVWSSLSVKRTWNVSNSWMGSLVLHSRDPSGQYYRRNRYYDPESGRFTQEDPIGLAGGLNLYGYADGDPINKSDPFGLYAQDNCDPPGSCLAKGVAVGTTLGAGVGVVVAGGCTAGSGGICALGAPAIIPAFAGGGAAVGGLAGSLVESAGGMSNITESVRNSRLARGLMKGLELAGSLLGLQGPPPDDDDRSGPPPPAPGEHRPRLPPPDPPPGLRIPQ